MRIKVRPIIILFFILSLLLFSSCKYDIVKDDYSWNENHIIGMDDDFEKCWGLNDGEGKTAHVIILTGQSNCTGCSITSYLKDQISEDDFSRYENGFENVHINFNIDNHRTCSEGEFRKTNLECGSFIGEFGPEVGIADILHKTYPEEDFFIIKLSMSGYTLNYHWMREYDRGEIYNSTILFAKKSLDYIKSMNYIVSLEAVMFMQGESDTTEYKTDRYYKNLNSYVSFLREDLKDYTLDKGLFFIDAGISDSPYNLPSYKELNEIKRKFSEESELNRYFSTIENGLTTINEPYDNPDLGHFDALSEIRLGELFAEELVRIYQTTL